MESIDDAPRLRPVEIVPLSTARGAVRRWLLSDPAGHLEAPLELSAAALLLLALCDGTRTREAIRSEHARRSGQELSVAELDAFLSQMDRLLLLESPRFREHLAKEARDWAAREWREAAHAGGAYPAEPAALRAALDGWLGAAPLRAPPRRRLRALVAPHLDFHRGGAGYGRAYAALRAFEPPDVVVLLGTGHAAEGGRFIATAKGFETPLGRLPLDRPFLARLESALGTTLFRGEAAHRREHSLEFQAVWLAHLFPRSIPAIVPIVATTFDDLFEPGAGPLEEPSAGEFLRALRSALRADPRRVLLLAGADLAHVGPRFGDPTKATAPFLAEVRARDAAALEALVTGDSAGFLGAVASHRNRDRICSVASLYATLFAAEASAGELLVYDQAVDPEGELAVTYAGAALYGDLDDARGLRPLAVSGRGSTPRPPTGRSEA
jgi:AmmeMemoRadiSam system protein B